MAPYEVLVQATINDLYFVHQRATRIAVWNLFLLCGICGAGFISGYIIEDLGYHWAFWICGILFGVFGVGILFFVPETTYIRNTVTSQTLAKTGIQDQERGAVNEKLDEKGMHVEYHNVPRAITGNGSSLTAATEGKMSYLKSLSCYTGRYTDQKIWKIFARPFIMVSLAAPKFDTVLNDPINCVSKTFADLGMVVLLPLRPVGFPHLRDNFDLDCVSYIALAPPSQPTLKLFAGSSLS